jgi:hypothetical protein
MAFVEAVASKPILINVTGSTSKALRPAATFEISFYHFSHDPPGEPIIRDF